MPRNRRPQDREEKRREIVEAAVAVFGEVGFEQASMARIAQAAGVTPNTVYWYVADKDALLVAVLDHLLVDALARLEHQGGATLADQVMWGLEQLQRHRALVGVVHARSEHSPTVATWHDGFHALMDATVVRGLQQQGVTERDAATIARLTTFAVEGLLAHPTGATDARAMIEHVLGRRPPT